MLLPSAALLLPLTPAGLLLHPPVWRRTHVRACAFGGANDEMEMPLLDPLTDELPFPFPSEIGETGRFRYAFARPAHQRMLDDAEEDSWFGHCVSLPDDAPEQPAGALSLAPTGLARVGAVGVAVRLESLERAEGPRVSGRVASVVAICRFKVVEITRTFPFPVARVRVLRDSPPFDDDERAATAALEAEVERQSVSPCYTTPTTEH